MSTTNLMRPLVKGFGTFRLFRTGRADQIIRESRQRQAESLKRLNHLFPTSTQSKKSVSSGR